MKIADVFNEKSKEYYRQENASEYAYITADEYTSEEVIEMEKQILTLLDFNCFSPTIPHFLKLIDMPENLRILCNYLSDLMLLTTKTLKFKPSQVSQAIFYLATASLEIDMSPVNSNDISVFLFSDTPFDQFLECVKVVQRCWADMKTSTSSKHQAVNTKFENIQIISKFKHPMETYYLI